MAQLTRLLRVGDVVRNHNCGWYGDRRRVTGVFPRPSDDYRGHYTFIAIGGQGHGASSTTTFARTIELFACRDWEWDYPEHVQLPEGI